MSNDAITHEARERLKKWASQHSNVTPLDGTDRNSPTFGDLRLVLAQAERAVDLQRMFNIRWDAQMRGIKRWQEAHPGNELVWPDHADLIFWLLGEKAKQNAEKKTDLPLEGC